LSNRYLKVGVESTFGTAATTLTPIRAIDISPNINHDIIELESLDGWGNYDAIYGGHTIKFNWAAYAIKGQLDPVLSAALGASSAGDTGTVYTIDAPKSLTCEYGDRYGNAEIYLGVIPNQLKFTIKAKAAVQYEVDGIGKAVEKGTYSAPTYDNTLPYVAMKTSVTFGGTSIPVRNIDITIARNIKNDDFILDSYTMAMIQYGKTEVSGSITVLENNVDEFYRALFGDSGATALQDSPTKVKIVIDAATPDGADTLKITLPSVIYPSTDYRARGKEPYDKTINFISAPTDISIEVSA